MFAEDESAGLEEGQTAVQGRQRLMNEMDGGILISEETGWNPIC